MEMILRDYPSSFIEARIRGYASLEQLLEGLKSRQVTAVQVVCVYASIIHKFDKQSHALSEYMVLEALERAHALDDYRERTGKCFGPLHGLPILFSDECAIANTGSLLGCPCRKNHSDEMDAPLVSALKDLGAIPLFKTHVSWHLMFPDSGHPLGSVENTKNKGASFGGRQGALSHLMANVNLGCLIGFGTEQVGGMRISSSFNGVYTFKPTSIRIPRLTNECVWKCLDPVACPVAKSLEDLTLLVSILMQKPSLRKDTKCAMIPFDSSSFTSTKQLKIGYIEDNQIIRAFPGAQRALAKAISILKSHGHECVPFDVPTPKTPFHLLSKLFDVDHPSQACLSKYALEQLTRMESILPFIIISRLPQIGKSFLSYFAKSLLDDGTASEFIRHLGGSTSLLRHKPTPISTLESEMDEYKHLFRHTLESNQIDLLISPIHACPPLQASANPLVASGSFYSSLFNILNLPCGILPSLIQIQNLDVVPNVVHYAHNNSFLFNRQFRSLDFQFLSVLGIEESNQGILKGNALGSSIGIQVIGHACEDESVLNLLTLLQRESGQ